MQVYLAMGHEVSRIADSPALGARHTGGSSRDFLYSDRLSGWLERAVLTDLVNNVEHTLSPNGKQTLDRFREEHIYEHVQDESARAVFCALDRRDVWGSLDRLHIKQLELFNAAGVICSTVDRIRAQLWEGSFEEFVLRGVHKSEQDEVLEKQFINPAFRGLEGIFASYAQRTYEQGYSEQDALTCAMEMMKVSEEVRSLHGSDSSVQDGHTAETNMRPAVAEDTAKIYTRPAMVEELRNVFGDGMIEFASIDLGLTDVMDADEDVISSALKRAFNRTMPKKEFGLLSELLACLSNTDIFVTALSYKHKSKEIRMAEQTIGKVSRVIRDIASQKGTSKVVIWLDAILSANRDLTKSSWAVTGLYPYLTCDVIRVVGSDDDYDDGGESSMWMQVEKECADERATFHVTLDRSRRGYSWRPAGFKHRVPVKTRMMNLAQGICKGSLIGKLVSWPEDKRKLILWAEACMLANRPLLMNEEALQQLSTLRVDNISDEDVTHYFSKARERGFVGRFNGNSTVLASWLGIFELVPGLSEATREATRRAFRPLLPCVPTDKKARFRTGWDEYVVLEIGGMRVVVELERESNSTRKVFVD